MRIIGIIYEVIEYISVIKITCSLSCHILVIFVVSYFFFLLFLMMSVFFNRLKSHRVTPPGNLIHRSSVWQGGTPWGCKSSLPRGPAWHSAPGMWTGEKFYCLGIMHIFIVLSILVY